MLLEFKLCQRKYFVLQFITTVSIWEMMHTAVESRNLVVHSVCQHMQTKTYGFSSVAVCGFTYVNTGAAAYTFCVLLYKCW